MRRSVLGLAPWALGLLLVASCAARLPVPPPTTATLKYPEFMFPAVPASLAAMPGADSVGFGWRFLQVDDLRNAERSFQSGLQQVPSLYPAQAGLAYVALARRDHARAVTAFDAALKSEPRYVPALLGKGQALLALKRDTEALAVFEAALAADGSKTIPEEVAAGLRSRIQVLQFRGLQEIIEGARSAAAAGRLEDARLAYGRALDASPDSTFLHRELGIVERKLGATAAALEHFRRATALDPDDAASLVQIGELLEQQQDFAGAEAAYRKAAAVLPSADLSRRIAALEERMREARLPAEFRAIGAAPEITRADLAALLGIRLDPVLRGALPREVVMTDVRGHWAESWITQAARAGVLEAFPNHTFQPGQRVRRADLAGAISRVVALLAERMPALRVHLTARPAIADMPATHLDYPAASVAVSAGILPLLEGNRFQVARTVTGAEATAAIDRLLTLAGLAR
jgi:tetratricopeptide (TPR) repeat protein